jgi:anti-sigma-K factor RskA
VNPHDDVEAYVLGALDAADVRAFELHAAACTECRESIASYAGVLAALRRLPLASPPPMPRVRRVPLAWRLGAGIAAAIALAGGLGAAFTASRGDDDARAIAEMLGAHARMIALAGPAAHGSALVDAGGHRTAFVLSGLPQAPRGRGYQVWVRGATVRSPGMLHRLRDGLEVLVVDGDAIGDAKRIGITEERAGGSPMRTGPVEAGATLPS